MVPAVTTIAFRNTPLYIEEILPRAAGAGYRGLEVWGGHIEKRDEREMPVIAELAARHGMEIPVVSCHIGVFDLKMTNMEAQLRQARFAASMAALLGAPSIRAFAGWVMECSSRDAPEDYWKYCIDGLREIARIAAEKRLMVAVETHKLSLADTVRGCMRIVDEVQEPNVRFILQLDGPAETENKTPVQVWRELSEHVVHVHLKPEPAPFTVHMLRELFDNMRTDGYKGAVSIEAAHPDVQPGPLLKRGMELLRAAGAAA